ncbi:hypothetical protein B296_00038273 [Ensete ventricosum]|uniref:Uncharacterized protein n=1 Tax=Ensete ventricosum TaxID=4639 RepID=A0A426XDM3_ENSVE|nr:hypothetical protein B296_00038273 [Ensete ventricosum]
MDLPRWEDEDPTEWISRAERYFHSHRTPEASLVDITVIHLRREAAQLYDWYKHTHGVPTWRPSVGVAGQGQAACRGGGLSPRSPARGLPAAVRAAYKSSRPRQARNQATASLQQRLPHARAAARRSARRDDAHGGATRDRGTGRKGRPSLGKAAANGQVQSSPI